MRLLSRSMSQLLRDNVSWESDAFMGFRLDEGRKSGESSAFNRACFVPLSEVRATAPLDVIMGQSRPNARVIPPPLAGDAPLRRPKMPGLGGQ